jgi:hypothetical protein
MSVAPDVRDRERCTTEGIGGVHGKLGSEGGRRIPRQMPDIRAGCWNAPGKVKGTKIEES